jgi:hypothetical protein
MIVAQRHESALNVVQIVGELNQFQPAPPWAEHSCGEHHKRLDVHYFIGHIQGSARIHCTGITRGDLAVFASSTIVVRKRKVRVRIAMLIPLRCPTTSYTVAQQKIQNGFAVIASDLAMLPSTIAPSAGSGSRFIQ